MPEARARAASGSSTSAVTGRSSAGGALGTLAAAPSHFRSRCRRAPKREVEFTVWAASANIACPDFALTLRVKDERTLAGTTSDGREVGLTREPAKRNPR